MQKFIQCPSVTLLFSEFWNNIDCHFFPSFWYLFHYYWRWCSFCFATRCQYMIVFVQPVIIVFMDKMLECFVNWHIKWLLSDCHATRSYNKLAFLLLNLFLILSKRWPRNASIASILRGFDNTLGRRSHTHQSQSSINSNVIHAFFWAQTIMALHKIFFWQSFGSILCTVVI
jgi:hypothetical protein